MYGMHDRQTDKRHYFKNNIHIILKKRTMETRILKNFFNKNERRCRDVKAQKACEQGWEANIGPKITCI